MSKRRGPTTKLIFKRNSLLITDINCYYVYKNFVMMYASQFLYRVNIKKKKILPESRSKR